jgi:hypothetical protein
MVESGFLYFLIALEGIFIALLIYGITVKVNYIRKMKDGTPTPT